MQLRSTISLVVVIAALATGAGCAVTRGQETVGAYVDDATITTKVKTRLVEEKQVNSTAIGVETLNGTVMLSGFARSAAEQQAAERAAANVKGVKTVKNSIVVRE
jgi:osmotically-inducible protein OsmY